MLTFDNVVPGQYPECVLGVHDYDALDSDVGRTPTPHYSDLGAVVVSLVQLRSQLIPVPVRHIHQSSITNTGLDQ